MTLSILRVLNAEYRTFAGGTALCLASVLGGCVLFVHPSDLGESWKGSPLSRLIDAWGAPAETIQQQNGRSEVKFDLDKGKCLYYVTVDPAGTIVSYRYEGKCWGCCRPVG